MAKRVCWLLQAETLKSSSAVRLMLKSDPTSNNDSKSGLGSVQRTRLIKASGVNTAPPPTRIKLCSLNELRLLSVSSREAAAAAAALVCMCVCWCVFTGEVLILTGTGLISCAASRVELADLACLLNQN